MPEKMSKRETSRSRSRSPRSTSHSHMKGRSRTPDRRSVTPDRRKRSRNRYSKDKSCRSPSHSHTRSRTPRRYKGKYSESRSRSRSFSPFERRSYDRRKSYSRSPLSQRRRHVGTREHPQQSRCLGVFGLSIFTTEQKINEIFSKYGKLKRVQVVIDAKTAKSRGFCFVYFENAEDAKNAKDQCSGMTIDDRRIRVDYSITQRAHTPTPGVYMGKPTRLYREREYHDRYRDEEYYKEKQRTRDRHSPSPHYHDRRRRYERSRSRSYSPRDRRYR